MDSFTPQQTQLDLSKLSDLEKRELQQSVQNEMQKAKIQDCLFHRPRPPTTDSLSPSFSLANTTNPFTNFVLTSRWGGFFFSCAQSDGYLLDEMYDEGDFEWEIG